MTKQHEIIEKTFRVEDSNLKVIENEERRLTEESRKTD